MFRGFTRVFEEALETGMTQTNGKSKQAFICNQRVGSSSLSGGTIEVLEIASKLDIVSPPQIPLGFQELATVSNSCSVLVRERLGAIMKERGEMMSEIEDYAALARRHGCPDDMSPYAFIAERLGKLAGLEKVSYGAGGSSITYGGPAYGGAGRPVDSEVYDRLWHGMAAVDRVQIPGDPRIWKVFGLGGGGVGPYGNPESYRLSIRAEDGEVRHLRPSKVTKAE